MGSASTVRRHRRLLLGSVCLWPLLATPVFSQGSAGRPFTAGAVVNDALAGGHAVAEGRQINLHVLSNAALAGRSVVIEVRSSDFEPSLTVVRIGRRPLLGIVIGNPRDRGPWQGEHIGPGVVQAVVTYPSNGDSLQVQVSARQDDIRLLRYRLAAWDPSARSTSPLAGVVAVTASPGALGRPLDIHTVSFRDWTYPLRGTCAQVLGGPGARPVSGDFEQNGQQFVVDTVLYSDLTGDGQLEAVVLAHCGPPDVASPGDSLLLLSSTVYAFSVRAGTVRSVPLPLPDTVAGESEWIERIVAADGILSLDRPFLSDSVARRVFRWNGQSLGLSVTRVGPQVLGGLGPYLNASGEERAWPVTGERWFALYSSDSAGAADSLVEVALRVSRAPGCGGDSSGTAIQIAGRGGESPRLLVSGVLGLQAGLVQRIRARRGPLRPGTQLAFSLNSVRYRLWTTRTSRSAPGAGTITLRLTVGSRTELPLTSDEPPDVLWIGDLDRDGAPEVLVATERGWSLLFLQPPASSSRRAPQGSLVRMMAFLRRVSC
jgi:hypothetical protein